MPRRITMERAPVVIAERSERTESGCLRWNGSLDGSGYGHMVVSGKHFKLHRLAYELARGELSPELDLDHLCHTADPDCEPGRSCLHRRCVNPDHLEPVTRAENNRRAGARRTSCRNGHPYDEANDYRLPGSGRRHCRLCNRAACARYHARRRGAA